jgi:phospholipase C
MACCEPDQIPALYTLAVDFAICDNWFSSMPGPTWPNRLFAMGASSAGLDDSPSDKRILWFQVDGVDYPNGSIFDRLTKFGWKYRLYSDYNNVFAANPASESEGGGLSIVQALSGIDANDLNPIENLANDLKGSYPYYFTFIEPNYGDVTGDTYSGGSSQHAMDSLAAGDAMVASVYQAIRNSPLWETSLLIITYDEHGGFYDHVAPIAAKPPGDGDGPGSSLNTHGFDFSRYGVRVPAVIVSPLIPKGTVDHTEYDHTSILRTLENFLNLAPLTQRDGVANSVARNLTEPTARTDCPTTIGSTVPAPAPAPTEMVSRPSDDDPLPEKGNVIGFLHIAAKTDWELSGKNEAAKTLFQAKLQAIKTKGQARAYFGEVMAKLKTARAAKAETPAVD